MRGGKVALRPMWVNDVADGMSALPSIVLQKSLVLWERVDRKFGRPFILFSIAEVNILDCCLHRFRRYQRRIPHRLSVEWRERAIA